MKTGITGGIGSGKSYVCQRLKTRGITVYDCDAAAKRLMRTSAELRQKLTALIGPNTYRFEHGTYELNKAAVAQFLLTSDANAKAIDDIVHPAVFSDFEKSGEKWMESAIIYESGIYTLVDNVVVVTAPEELRIQRIMARDSITKEKAIEWMHRQWPQQQVRQRAHFEIVNDGVCDIDSQIDLLLQKLSEQENKQNINKL